MTTLDDLIVQETKDTILARGLGFATTLGVPVTSWQVGDPTEALFHFVAEILETVEEVAANYTKSAFLDIAAEDSTLYDWLVIVADQVYGYTASAATYSTCTVRLTNGGGGLYVFDPGDVTVKDSTTGTTFHNTTGGTLASGPATTLDLTFVADTAGTDGSSGIGDIDTMVTTYLGVTCANTTVALGVDAESAASIVDGCRAKLGSLSPNGPADAYAYVALNSELTTSTVATKVRVTGDSATGNVSIVVASDAGTVGGGDLTLIQAAIDEWATPLCVTATVTSATGVTIPVTYEISAYTSWGLTDAEVEQAVEDSLAAWFADRPIGGDIIPPATVGLIQVNMLEAAIRETSNKIIAVSVTAPATYTTLTASQVAVLGTCTATIDWVDDP
jgi:hypothetical protein